MVSLLLHCPWTLYQFLYSIEFRLHIYLVLLMILSLLSTQLLSVLSSSAKGSLSMDIAYPINFFFYISQMRYPILVLISLTYVTQYYCLKSHPGFYEPFISNCNHITFYCVHRNHNFFNHLSAVGHLSHFHILGIVLNAAIIIIFLSGIEWHRIIHKDQEVKKKITASPIWHFNAELENTRMC